MPRRDLRAYLQDVADACERITAYTAHIPDAQTYAADTKTREAVERCFQIIGEGLVELRDRDPERFASVSHGAAIIRFRNMLVHAYFNLDAATVWDSIQHDVDLLRKEALALLADPGR